MKVLKTKDAMLLPFDKKLSNAVQFYFKISGKDLEQKHLKSDDLPEGPLYYKDLIDLRFEIKKITVNRDELPLAGNSLLRLHNRPLGPKYEGYSIADAVNGGTEIKWNWLEKETILRQIADIPHAEYISKVKPEKLTSKLVHELLANQMWKRAAAVAKWEEKLGEKEPHWWEITFGLIRKCTKNNSERLLLFKILHRLLNTRHNLRKWGKTNDDICELCNENRVEDLQHYFIDCNFNNLLVGKVIAWCAATTKTCIEVGREDLFVGIQGNYPPYILQGYNNMLMKCKIYLVKCRRAKQRPSMEGLLEMIAEAIQTEMYLVSTMDCSKVKVPPAWASVMPIPDPLFIDSDTLNKQWRIWKPEILKELDGVVIPPQDRANLY